MAFLHALMASICVSIALVGYVDTGSAILYGLALFSFSQFIIEVMR